MGGSIRFVFSLLDIFLYSSTLTYCCLPPLIGLGFEFYFLCENDLIFTTCSGLCKEEDLALFMLLILVLPLPATALWGGQIFYTDFPSKIVFGKPAMIDSYIEIVFFGYGWD